MAKQEAMSLHQKVLIGVIMAGSVALAFWLYRMTMAAPDESIPDPDTQTYIIIYDWPLSAIPEVDPAQVSIRLVLDEKEIGKGKLQGDSIHLKADVPAGRSVRHVEVRFYHGDKLVRTVPFGRKPPEKQTAQE